VTPGVSGDYRGDFQEEQSPEPGDVIINGWHPGSRNERWLLGENQRRI
jgi:hypothetical protein